MLMHATNYTVIRVVTAFIVIASAIENDLGCSGEERRSMSQRSNIVLWVCDSKKMRFFLSLVSMLQRNLPISQPQSLLLSLGIDKVIRQDEASSIHLDLNEWNHAITAKAYSSISNGGSSIAPEWSVISWALHHPIRGSLDGSIVKMGEWSLS